MPELNVSLADDTHALAVNYGLHTLYLVCARAYPPGKPLALRAELSGEFVDLQGKSAGCKLRGDGRYDVTLRLVSLRREQRVALEQTFPNPKPPSTAHD
jgi:hypothetical protein